MQNRYPLAFVILFLGLLLVPIFPLSQALPSQFSSFPLRDKFVSAVTGFRLRMGDRVYHNALLGPNGWLVYANNRTMDYYQNARPLTSSQLDTYAQSLLAFRSLVEANGGHLLFVVAPYKNTIYPEYVPSEIRPIGEESQLDQIIGRLASEPSIHILDLRPALLQAKQKAQIYYSTDSHWNDLGAFIAYQTIIDALEPDFSQLSPRPLSDFKISYQAPALLDLSYIIGSTSLVEKRVQLQPRFQRTARIESLMMPSGRQITFASNTKSNLPTALFFHDSYLYPLMPFLSEQFSHTYYVDLLAGDEPLPPFWVGQIQPDVVVIVLNEHFLDILPELFTGGRPDFGDSSLQ